MGGASITRSGNNLLMEPKRALSSLTRVGATLDHYPASGLLSASTVMVLGLGVIDYVTGPNLAFSIFYLLPIALVAWRFHYFLAAGAAALAAATWTAADIASDAEYSSPLVPVWNTASRLGVFIFVAGLIHVLRIALDEQRILAQTDPLTGVLNARTFNERAADHVLDAERLSRPLTFAFIDVDDFKAVNDTLGHSGGDRVLRALASALEEVTRDTDLVGRLGGDEFALLMPATGSNDAARVMSVLLERVHASMKMVQHPVTFSAGAVTFLVPPDDVDAMVSTADDLMYEAKRAGKSTFRHVTIGEGMPEAARDRSESRRIDLDAKVLVLDDRSVNVEGG